MAKNNTIFTCQNCGAQSPKWLGRCPECNNWNTYVEEQIAEEVKPTRSSMTASANFSPTPLPDISTDASEHDPVGIAELDRVLGGGIVPGSVILIGGDPGIGKSTIVLQAFGSIASKASKDAKYYISPAKNRLRR